MAGVTVTSTPRGWHCHCWRRQPFSVRCKDHVNSLSSTTTSGHPGDVLEKPAGNPLRTRLSLAALGLLVLTTWILQRPYRGLNHDSVLYTFLALARLFPASLARDVILR